MPENCGIEKPNCQELDQKSHSCLSAFISILKGSNNVNLPTTIHLCQNAKAPGWGVLSQTCVSYSANQDPAGWAKAESNCSPHPRVLRTRAIVLMLLLASPRVAQPLAVLAVFRSPRVAQRLSVLAVFLSSGPAMILLLALLTELGRLHARMGKTMGAWLPSPCTSEQSRALSGEQFPVALGSIVPPFWIPCCFLPTCNSSPALLLPHTHRPTPTHPWHQTRAGDWWC